MKIPTFSYFFDLSYYLTPCILQRDTNAIRNCSDFIGRGLYWCERYLSYFCLQLDLSCKCGITLFYNII